MHDIATAIGLDKVKAIVGDFYDRVHAMAGFTPELLVDWLSLFQVTLNSHLPADIAEQWFARATNIGRSLKLLHEAGRGLAVEHANSPPRRGVQISGYR